MIEWIVSSSALILLVLAVRALAKSRLSCRARYALWLLVLVRLLVPTQLFTASWGVTEAELPERVTERNIYVLPTGSTELPGSVIYDDGPISEELLKLWADDHIRMTDFDWKTVTYTRYAAKWSVADILRIVWLAGASALALVLLVSNLRFARRLRRTRVPYDALVGGMRVYVAEGLASPCLVGVFRPTVYLTPEATQDERTLRHVLAHETTHRLHGDCVWSLLRLIALCLHWYNPLVWLAVAVSKRDGELACDEATLARLGEDERFAYGETLLSMVTAKPRGRDLLSATTAMTAGKKPMRERIEIIAKHPRTKAVALLLALAVLLTATVFAFSRAETSDETPQPEQDGQTPPVETIAPAEPMETTLFVTDSYSVDARRIVEDGWSIAIPKDGWTRKGDTWTSAAGSTLSVKWLASRDDCDLAPYMEHWDWTSDALDAVAYQDETNHLRLEAHLFAAPDGGYWQVLTRYDTELSLMSSWTGLEPRLLEAMAASFTVDAEPQEVDEAAFFAAIAGEYMFLSGAGGWHTELSVYEDGAFTGRYEDADAGVVLYSDFGGRFTEPRKVNDYTWSMRLLDLTAEPAEGEVSIEDGIRYVGSTPYGMEGAGEVLVYLPGAPVSALPEEFLQWYCAGLSYGRRQIGGTLPTVGLYNVAEQYGWFPRSLIESGWEPLTTDELVAWSERFDWPAMADDAAIERLLLVDCFFTSYYSTPRDIDLVEFLAYFPLGEVVSDNYGTIIDEAERAAVIATGKYPGEFVPTHRYRVSDINAALTQYAGITLDDMTTDWRNNERMIYLPEYDAFYNFTSDFDAGMFAPERGECLGSIVRLYGQWSTLQVTGTPDSFRIMSFTEQ